MKPSTRAVHMAVAFPRSSLITAEGGLISMQRDTAGGGATGRFLDVRVCRITRNVKLRLYGPDEKILGRKEGKNCGLSFKNAEMTA